MPSQDREEDKADSDEDDDWNSRINDRLSQVNMQRKQVYKKQDSVRSNKAVDLKCYDKNVT